MKSSAMMKPVQFRVNPNREHFAYGKFREMKGGTLKRHSPKGDRMVTIGERREKLWTLFQADQRWSKFVRARDGKCMRCGATENQTNSHYHGRKCNSVRFHPDNCDDFCVFCHEEWETKKKSEYREWKIAQLGITRFRALQALAMRPMKQSEAIRQCMIYLAERKLPIDESIPTLELAEIRI